MYKRDEAVSPVIGVILMVAITVILAAVIAAFVFGMTGSVSKTKTVAVVSEMKTPTQIIVTNMGGQDVKQLTDIVTKVNGADEDPIAPAEDNQLETVASQVGSYSVYSVAAGDRVTVTGIFKDGTSAVLLDKTIV